VFLDQVLATLNAELGTDDGARGESDGGGGSGGSASSARKKKAASKGASKGAVSAAEAQQAVTGAPLPFLAPLCYTFP